MSPEDVAVIEQRAAYARIVTCPNPACDPAGHALCSACQAVFDAAFPARCPDPGCDVCTAEAVGAER